jgi:hypothetical protein
VAVAACSSTPGPVTSPSHGSGATIDAAPATGADADPDQITLYRSGKFLTRPRASATQYDGCVGGPAELAACKQLDPAATCELAPWLDAGDIYCRGEAMGPEDMPKPVPPEPCGCTCAADYKKAQAEWGARAQACARVP